MRTQLADGSRLGWRDGFLIVAIASLLAFSLLLQVSPQPSAILDAARDTALALTARAIEALQDLPELLS